MSYKNDSSSLIYSLSPYLSVGYIVEVDSNVQVSISYEPLAHSQLGNDVHVLRYGGRIGLYNRPTIEPQILFETIQYLSPTSIAGVPRIWDIIHNEYKKAVHLEMERIKEMEDGAIKNDSNNNNNNTDGMAITEEEKRKRVEEEVLNRFGGLLGKRLRYITTGGAPTSPDVIQFLKR